MNMRPATYSDFRDFYSQPVPHTARAWVMENDGVVFGIGGVYFENGKPIAFSEFRQDLPKRDRVRGTRKIMEIVQSIDGPVYAVQGPFETAPGLLARLGFQPIPDSEYWFWRAQ